MLKRYAHLHNVLPKGKQWRVGVSAREWRSDAPDRGVDNLLERTAAW